MRRHVMSSILTSSSLIDKEDSFFHQMMYKAYGVKAGIFAILLLLASSAIFYQIFVNYVPYDTFAVAGKRADKKLFFLKSTETINKLGSFGIKKEGYLARLKDLEKLFVNQGFAVQYVNETDVSTLPLDSVLFAFDTIALSDKSVKDIEKFVSDGGFLVFNYHFAYNSEDKYRGNEVVHRFTGLKHPEVTTHLDASSSGGTFYLLPKFLSPLTKAVHPYIERTEIYSVDPIPLFISNTGLEPDIKWANYTMNSTPVLKDGKKQVSLSSDQVGALWHGSYEKGNWVYFSFPSYGLYSVEESVPILSMVMEAIVEFATQPATLISYPYIDAKKVIFVSEDTEYKFKSFYSFINVAEKYKVPVTAFIVSNLAEKEEYLPAINLAKNSPFIEMASHSHTHKKIIETSAENIEIEILESKKIIDKLSQKNLTGFRPPREEINELMIETLKSSGYEYVLEKNKGYVYPRDDHNGLYTIPRTATDDYQFLVTLEWSPDEIVKRMIYETEFITSMEGIYSLSVHTHLMAYKSNIQILDKYFQYLSQHPEYTAMQGKDVIDRVMKQEKISYDIKQTQKNYLIDVVNKNSKTVENLTFRVFWLKSTKVNSINAEIRGIKVKYTHNQEARYTDITVSTLKPLSTLKLIANYEM